LSFIVIEAIAIAYTVCRGVGSRIVWYLVVSSQLMNFTSTCRPTQVDGYPIQLSESGLIRITSDRIVSHSSLLHWLKRETISHYYLLHKLEIVRVCMCIFVYVLDTRRPRPSDLEPPNLAQ